MIRDLDKSSGELGRPDIVVVGSGPVGILVAIRLARAGKRVVLCECGGVAPDERMQVLNDAEVTGRPHLGVSEGRARLFGGGSTLWGGQLISFQEIDFEGRPWLSQDEWPIRRTDIAPYFDTAAEMLGLRSTEDDDASIWRQVGHERPELGQDLKLLLTRWLKQPHLPALFRQELRNHPKLEVLTHACVVGFGQSGSRISTVRLRSPNGAEVSLGAEQFVLACGTIELSRLLLSTALDTPDLPWAGNVWIGRGFQDHLDLRAGAVTPLDRRRFDDIFSNIFLKGFKYSPKVSLAPHTQAALKTTNIAGVMVYDSSFIEHLRHLKLFLKAVRSGSLPPNLAATPAHIRALAALWRPLIVRYVRDGRMFDPGDLGVGLRVHCEQRPLDRSQITVKPNERDALGIRRCVLDWQVDGIEIETIAVFCETLKRKMEDMQLARLDIDPLIRARDPRALAGAQDTNHHCGGLRMAANANAGVVDENARVFGVANLFVAGAAIFPSSSFANPTFTAMALALRLADHLIKSAP